jgi:hypothetical protein
MSNITLPQTAEKPAIVAIEHQTSSFADIRPGRSFGSRNRIAHFP